MIDGELKKGVISWENMGVAPQKAEVAPQTAKIAPHFSKVALSKPKVAPQTAKVAHPLKIHTNETKA